MTSLPKHLTETPGLATWRVQVHHGLDSDRVTSVIRTTLKLKGYKDELLNVGAAYYAQLSKYPIVGGTGDFRFVQGYMTTSVVDINHPTTCYKVDFYLF
ncbi:Dirigent protein 11 [Bienertia sinuspersici]